MSEGTTSKEEKSKKKPKTPWNERSQSDQVKSVLQSAQRLLEKLPSATNRVRVAQFLLGMAEDELRNEPQQPAQPEGDPRQLGLSGLLNRR